MVKEKFKVDVQEIPRLKVFLEENLATWGVREQDLMDIILACDEAATNIVVHAYKDQQIDDHEDKIQLVVKKKNNIIKIILRDHGKSFDPSCAPKPDISQNLEGKRKGGFGVFLMKTLMSRIHYQCKNGQNTTVLLKVLSP